MDGVVQKRGRLIKVRCTVQLLGWHEPGLPGSGSLLPVPCETEHCNEIVSKRHFLIYICQEMFDITALHPSRQWIA